jgi:hypothetical protein
MGVGTRPPVPVSCAALCVLLLSGCGSGRPVRRGEAFDFSQALPLAQVMPTAASPQSVTVSGRIAEVCRSSGCWFVLQDSSGGKDFQIYVDLTHGADFTVSPDVIGRKAIVKGRIVGEKPDLRLYAVGLVLVSTG